MGMDLRPVMVVVGTVKHDCPIGELLLGRRPAALRYRGTTETAVCDSLLSEKPPKYWACPEELLPRYADGILVGRHTEG